MMGNKSAIAQSSLNTGLVCMYVCICMCVCARVHACVHALPVKLFTQGMMHPERCFRHIVMCMSDYGGGGGPAVA
jgi:hypothetical protein